MTTDTLRESAAVAKEWMGDDWFGPGWSVMKPFNVECRDFIQLATPDTILDLLAAHDADKARIAVLEAEVERRSKALRIAVLALAHAAETNKSLYQKTYEQVNQSLSQASEVE